MNQKNLTTPRPQKSGFRDEYFTDAFMLTMMREMWPYMLKKWDEPRLVNDIILLIQNLIMRGAALELKYGKKLDATFGIFRLMFLELSHNHKIRLLLLLLLELRAGTWRLSMNALLYYQPYLAAMQREPPTELLYFNKEILEEMALKFMP